MTDLERTFLTRWLQLGDRDNEPATEHHFDPERKWRLDFAFIPERVGIELHGMPRQGGKSRHTTFMGFAKDREKMNRAQVLGWIVLEYTIWKLDKEPVEVIQEVLDAIAAQRERYGLATSTPR